MDLNTLPDNAPAAIATPRWLPAMALSLVAAALLVAMYQEQPADVAYRVAKRPATMDYRGEWRRDTHIDLSRTLAAQRIDDCAEMAYRPHRSFPGEYLVYCSSGGRGWTAWLVWPGSQKVAGPYSPDPLLPAP